jgi:MFS transporter, CP family, cyanate transporter
VTEPRTFEAGAKRQSRAKPAPSWLVVAGVLVAALSLRGPMLAVSPVLRPISADLGLSAAVAGLLTTAPVLAFAVLSPLAALAIRKAGAELAVLVTLLGVLLGDAIRTVPTFEGLATGTLVMGAAVALGNVAVPVVIRRDVPPERAAAVTGAYAAMLNVGSVLTTVATAPLAETVGWPLALATWSVLTVAGVALWAAHLRGVRIAMRRHRHGVGGSADDVHRDAVIPTSEQHCRGRVVWRLPLAWVLAVAFSAQSFSYYAYTTWLPTYFADTQGASASGAGGLASAFQAWGIAGALIVPVLHRRLGARATALIVSACWLSMSLGVLFAPAYLALWLLLGGLAQAGGFVVIFSTIVLAARGTAEAASLSAFVQTIGYLLAASAGPVIGALNSATGGWTVPLAMIVVVTAVFGVLLVAGVTLAPGRRTTLTQRAVGESAVLTQSR